MTSLRRVLLPLLLLTATTAQAAKPERPSAEAVQAAKASVAYRALLMQQMGKTMKLADMIVEGKVDRKADLVAFAATLQAAPLTDLFPPGTGPDVVETGAKADLWNDPQGYADAVKAYQEKAAALSAAAASGDPAAAKSALDALGESCGGCHDRYRMER
mgnify:CR=1 FL=1|jgi:cytochrome c556